MTKHKENITSIMATFFSLYTCSSLLSLLLLLLSLTAGDLFLRADAALLEDVCSQTKQPRRCADLLSSSSSGSRTAALPELGQIAITADTDAAGDFKIKVQNLALSARDPKLKSLYRNCENLYLNGLDGLLIAPENLQKRAYNKVIAAAAVVSGGVRGCAAAVANNPGLERENEDTGILADAIAVIAKKLFSS